MYPNHIVPTKTQVVNTEDSIVNANMIKPDEFVRNNKVFFRRRIILEDVQRCTITLINLPKTILKLYNVYMYN